MRTLRLLPLLLVVLTLTACAQWGQYATGYPAPETHQDRGGDAAGGGM
jgi:peptidoglycan/LPS O-acetylase OafA/YrhL